MCGVLEGKKTFIKFYQADCKFRSRYILNPFLLNGYKADIRTYMLIAGTSPYMVFYHPGYVRLSLVPYSLNQEEVHAHLTNQVREYYLEYQMITILNGNNCIVRLDNCIVPQSCRLESCDIKIASRVQVARLESTTLRNNIVIQLTCKMRLDKITTLLFIYGSNKNRVLFVVFAVT